MSKTAERDFRRSEQTKRIANVIMLVGVVASLLMAFPMMIGFNPAIRTGVPLFFFVPFAAAVLLATAIKWARR